MRHIVLVLLTISLWSCQRKAVNNSHLSLVETNDSICFTLPEDVSVYNQSVQIHTGTDGSEYLYLLDNVNYKIYYYSLSSKEQAGSVQLSYDGPNNVGRPQSMLINGSDSIYIPDQITPTISIVDHDGNILRKIEVDDDRFVGFRSDSSHPFFIIGGKLYSNQNPKRNLATMGMEETSTEVAVDLSSGELTVSPCLIPESFKSKVMGRQIMDVKFMENSRCYDGEKIVYSYFGSPYITLLSQDLKIIGNRLAESSFIDAIDINVAQNDMDGESILRRACTEAQYGQIIYDSYRKLYYRFAYPETNLDEKDINLTDLIRSGRNEFSVIILDEDLNVVGETLFPRDRFRSNLYFVCKDGFYISCNHYKNPAYTDDELQFVKFEVKKN